MNEKNLNIRISEDLLEEIKKVAKEKNISASALVKMVMSDYLDEQRTKK